MSSRSSHNIVNFGPLTAEIGLLVWGTPANFSGFRDLAALLHGSQVVSVSQISRHWTARGRHLCSAGRPSRWALAHILVYIYILGCSTEFLLYPRPLTWHEEIWLFYVSLLWALHGVIKGAFGRPFVKRFALLYQTVVCPVCLSCLSVCNVRALWPNG